MSSEKLDEAMPQIESFSESCQPLFFCTNAGSEEMDECMSQIEAFLEKQSACYLLHNCQQ
jgi:hypothetical protein